jgi:hypothetical protein
MRKRSLLPYAVLVFMAAHCLPAFRLAGDVAWGFQATLLALMALPASQTLNLERGQLPAALLGILANLGYIVSFFTVGLAPSHVAKTTSVIAAAAAFLSVGVLLTGAEAFVPYPGCLLWLATGVLLVLGAFAEPPGGQPGQSRSENG